MLVQTFVELATIALRCIWLTVTTMVLALHDVLIAPSAWDASTYRLHYYALRHRCLTWHRMSSQPYPRSCLKRS